MRRLWLPFLIVVLLAACSSAPQRASRSGASSSASASHAWRTRPPGFPNFVDHSVGREEISIQAMGLVGIPYRWGGNTPDSGFDCSGLVQYVLARAASVNLPRTTADMSQRGEPVEPDDIAAGDLVFFNTTGRPHSHVGIYVGKLRFVDAPSTGGTVRLDYLTNPYWARHFDGIRRVAPAKRAPTPFDTPTWEAATPVERAPTLAQTPVERAPAVAAPAAVVAAGAGESAGTGGSAIAPPAAAAATAPAAPMTPPTGAIASASQNRMMSAPQASAYAGGSPASADAFEPPPATLGAAQRQAREAGALTPNPGASGAPYGGAPYGAAPSDGSPAAAVATRQVVRAAPAAPAPARAAPDAIDAAADAFEPPPPAAATAARQAAQAGSQPVVPDAAGPAAVQIMRASTSAPSMPAPTQSSDDPIARFANGAF